MLFPITLSVPYIRMSNLQPWMHSPHSPRGPKPKVSVSPFRRVQLPEAGVRLGIQKQESNGMHCRW